MKPRTPSSLFQLVVVASGLSLLAAAPASLAVTIACGGGAPIMGAPDPMNPDRFVFGVACGGIRFDGEAIKVDTGNPSDLFVSGTWELTPDDGPEIRTFTFREEGYTLPAAGPAVAWHRLAGNVNLVGAGALAELSVDGTLNGVFTLGTTTGLLGDGDAFNIRGPDTIVNSDPLWTRTATYTVSFDAAADAGSRINFAMTGENPFAAPEPGTVLLFGLGLVGLACRRRLGT